MLKPILSSLIFTVIAQAALADGGTTSVEIDPSSLVTSRQEVTYVTDFGNYRVATEDLKRLIRERTALSDALGSLIFSTNEVSLSKDRSVRVSNLPAGYSAYLRTWVSAKLLKSDGSTTVIDRSTLSTKYFLMIDCGCE